MAEIEPLGKTQSTRVEYIDALRFFAAFSVVGFHWLFNGIAGGKVTSLGVEPLVEVAKYGSIGVAQFFVISGFVIGYSASNGSAGKFASGRGVRLFPAFWTGVILTSVVIVLWGAPEFTVTAPQVLANLTMVPQYLGQEPIDGVYWTLTLELMFYVAIFVALFVGLRRWLHVVFPVWAILMLVLTFAGYASIPLFGGYFAYFAGGAIIDLIRRSGATPLRVAGLVCAIIVSVMFTFGRISGWGTEAVDATDAVIRLTLNLLCFATVALALVPAFASASVPGSRWMGAVTYPVYLLHAHIGYVVLNSLATPENVWFVLAAMILGLIGASWLMHQVIEVRLAKTWKIAFRAVLERPIDSVHSRLARLWDTQRRLS